MNEGYLIINNDTKVVVATDDIYDRKVLEYNSNIKEILTNENIIEIIDERMTSCISTGKLLYNVHQKYLKIEKVNKISLLFLIILLTISLITNPIISISNISVIKVILIMGNVISILGIPTIIILKNQMQTEIEKNAFKMEILDREKTRLLTKNEELKKSGTKERIESRNSNVIEISHKKELEKLNKKVLEEINATYVDPLKKIKRKIRTR